MEHYKKALEQIANPVKFLTEEAEKQGNKLNGAAAVAISNDPIWLREIARNALMYNSVTEDKKAPVDAEEFFEQRAKGDFSVIKIMQEYASQERNGAIDECIEMFERCYTWTDKENVIKEELSKLKK